MKLFNVIEPNGPAVPLILSIPHSGTYFPEEIRNHYKSEFMEKPEDTDWFLHELYDFASDLGIVTVKANYSRWVIDLNRDPDSKPLYDDGRIITDLMPTTTFGGKEIYRDASVLDENERVRRLNEYYWPYYHEIEDQITSLKSSFPNVLLWDAHSIKHKVPSIQLAAFPDLILGDNEIRAANPLLINKAIEVLNSDNYSFSHNHPFKGGHITRYFGKPSENVHALQLEMTKINYMEKDELEYHEIRASQLKALLRRTLDLLGKIIQTL